MNQLRVYWASGVLELPPTVKTAADIREYGSRIERKLTAWWERLPDKSLECAVLDGLGIAAQPFLAQKDYAGLPMPAGLWE